MCNSVSHWPLPLGRLLVTGMLLAGISACDDGGSKRASFDLDPSPLPTNVISNGSLEASTTELTGWAAYTSEGSTAEATFEVETEETYRGDNALKASIIALGDQPYHIEAGPIEVPVTAGETYGLVGWIKGPVDGMANFTASLAQEPWTTFGNREVTFTGEWQQVAFTFTLPEDLEATAIRFPVQLNYAGNVGADIFIDGMQLIPTDPPPPPLGGGVDLVTNGSLEESETTASNWATSVASGSSVSVDSTESQDGNNSLKITFGSIAAGADPWAVEAGPVGVPVSEGETYTYSAWVKGSSGAKVNAIVQLPGTPYHTFAGQEVMITSEWQQITFDALIAEASTIPGYTGPTTTVRLFFHAGYVENTGAEIYIDNVQLLTQSDEPVANGSLEASDTAYDQ